MKLLLIDFLELRTEVELLLLDLNIPMEILLFSFFSTKASNPADPIVRWLSLLGFQAFNSAAENSGLSGTTSRSSESPRLWEAFPKREERDLRLLGRFMSASILSLLTSSLGVGIEEELDAVMVGDRAGRLGLLAEDWTLSLFRDLPRARSSSAVCLASFEVRIGGGRLPSREAGDWGRSGKSVEEDKGESGRGMVRGSMTCGREGEDCSYRRRQ